MGKFTYADGISVFQIVYYLPALLISLILLVRWKSLAWFFLSTFSILRLVGAIARLLTISNPNSNGIWTTALICTILGLSPLLMSTLTLVGRALRAFVKTSYVTVIVIAVHLLAGLALFLCIAGASDASSAASIAHEDKVKVGVCLYVPVVAILALLEVACLVKYKHTQAGEGKLILALMAAMPLICIRLLYALLTVFSNGGIFGLDNTSDGSETAALCMAVLEEMFVVIIYLTAGLKLPAKRPQEFETHAAAPKYEGHLPLQRQ